MRGGVVVPVCAGLGYPYKELRMVRVKVVVGCVEVRMGWLGFKVGWRVRVGIHKQGR